MPLQPHVWQALALNGALGGLAVVVLALLPLDPSARPSWRTQSLVGLVFGMASILALQTPLEMAPDLVLDMQAVIGAASAFAMGPVAAGLTILFAAVSRMAHGPGWPIAWGALLLAALVGLGWRALVMRRVLAFGPALFGLVLTLPLA